MRDFPYCLALINRNDSLRRESTSGGAFPVLASAFLKEGGIVCGAMFSDGMRVVLHKCVESWEEIQLMQKSKYVESDSRFAIKSCYEILKTGRKVLFVGTPCQVATLRKISGNPDTLLTCDLLLLVFHKIQ